MCYLLLVSTFVVAVVVSHSLCSRNIVIITIILPPFVPILFRTSGAAAAEDVLLVSPCDQHLRAHTDVIDFEPKFTYHGFRYASVSEIWWITPDVLCKDIMAGNMVEARVLASSLKEVGHVAMASDEWSAIERACVWSSRSNLMGVPTDCPQRDVSIRMRLQLSAARLACTVAFKNNL